MVATLNSAEWTAEIAIIVLIAILLAVLLVLLLLRRGRHKSEEAEASLTRPVVEQAVGGHAPVAVPAATGAAPVTRAPANPTPGTPPEWLPDPSGSPDTLRYWDGRCWTPHVARRS